MEAGLYWSEELDQTKNMPWDDLVVHDSTIVSLLIFKMKGDLLMRSIFNSI